MKSKQTVVIAVITAAILFIAGSLTIAGLVPAVAEAQTGTSTQSKTPRTITVVGEGKVTVAPDIARINLGVETLGADVKQASSDAAGTMEAILTALETQGIAGNDIQTSYYNIWLERPYGGVPEGGPTIGEVTYHVNNNVSVTVRDLNKLTDILSAVLDAGANSVNSIDFNVAEPDQLRSEARQKAVEDALATAQELADLNSVEVGEVVKISEVVTPGAFPAVEAAYAQGVGGGGVGPISPGQVEVSAQLQITYVIE